MQARVLLSTRLRKLHHHSRRNLEDGRKMNRSRVSSCILIKCMTLKERQRSSRLQVRRENEFTHSCSMLAPQDDWLTNSCSSSFLFVFPMALRGMASSTFTIVGVL